ncbi:MAG: hypothetical protein A2900_05755 [Candidatus Chisholmbacteria bacterium RIFCSPLOWO2_01_FULL_50_28]|uniref:Uncharacterized protein n=1 Tax=Candidatus Chisholmbacteria bacterium RIFCSPHIGHO2_01_FULL_52_32 TaxID=1797591 RepID=A0A1G1VQF9_9BACT|nr:MAG: hypothetical protein A2786_05530 [Candidatus Chisholmbacteria bacterium RIFCSPHIGHO2_01_FULL_52_32]OGY20542.1 MAG: hypothetical protein A2900_05755 [Candidatus Chisholmbacteria bacterium RIFCSPLOWO2_01_FULL_50_28]
MKSLRKVILPAVVATAICVLLSEVLFRLLTDAPTASPLRWLVTDMQRFTVLISVLLTAAVLLRRDDRAPEEVLMSGFRFTVKVYWLYIRIVVAIVSTAVVAYLVVGAVVGIFNPTDIAIYLGVPILTGFAAGILLLAVKALIRRSNNHQPSP